MMALFTPGIGRAGQGGVGHRRGDLRAHRPAPLRDAVHGPVPVSRRALAVVLGRPGGEALPLLRLRGGGRRDQVRRGEGGAARSPTRSRRWPTATGSSSSARRRIRGPRRSASKRGAADRAARAHGGLLRDLPARRAAGGEGARLPGRARAGGRGAGGVRGRLRAGDLGHGADPRPAGRLLGRGDRGGRAGAEEPEGQGPLRPLPLADRVPDPRRARAGAGVRGAGAAARPEAEVRQLAGGRAVLEAAHAVRDRAGAAADREERAGAGGRGLHGRARLPPGRDRARRSRSWGRRSRPSR